MIASTNPTELAPVGDFNFELSASLRERKTDFCVFILRINTPMIDRDQFIEDLCSTSCSIIVYKSMVSLKSARTKLNYVTFLYYGYNIAYNG